MEGLEIQENGQNSVYYCKSWIGEVKETLKRIEKGKVVGSYGIPILEVCQTRRSKKIPDEQSKNTLIPIFKNKGDRIV
ncbi:hypothetical protein CR513_00250, partial [Mucuna pruriens]